MPRLPPLPPLLRASLAPRTPAWRPLHRFSTGTSLRVDTAPTPPPSTPEAAKRHHVRTKKTKQPAEPVVVAEPLEAAKYLVGRSSNGNWPIYTDYKRGGNLHITTIQKITGDITALRDDLRAFLNKKEEDVRTNVLTRKVIVKGFHSAEIQDFLKSKGL